MMDAEELKKVKRNIAIKKRYTKTNRIIILTALIAYIFIYIVLVSYGILKGDFWFFIATLLVSLLVTCHFIVAIRAIRTGIMITFSRMGGSVYIKSEDKLRFYFTFFFYLIIGLALIVFLLWLIFIVNPSL